MIGVRFGELSFEGCCESCGRWFPIDGEFWPTAKRIWIAGSRRCAKVTQCRACLELHRKRDRLTYAERRRIYNRDWMRRYRARAA